MGIARHLAPDGAQAEALLGVIAGGAQPAVVEGQRLGARAFQEQLAVVGPRQRTLQDTQGAVAVQMGLEGLCARSVIGKSFARKPRLGVFWSQVDRYDLPVRGRYGCQPYTDAGFPGWRTWGAGGTVGNGMG